MYLLDTDIASYIIKSRSPSVDRRLAGIPGTQVAISAITRAELLYGLKRSPTNIRLHQVVDRFLQNVRVLSWIPEGADWYSEIRHQLVSTGQTIGELDMLIAAHALVLGATLVTNNMRHYARIKAPLLLENWTI